MEWFEIKEHMKGLPLRYLALARYARRAALYTFDPFALWEPLYAALGKFPSPDPISGRIGYGSLWSMQTIPDSSPTGPDLGRAAVRPREKLSLCIHFPSVLPHFDVVRHRTQKRFLHKRRWIALPFIFLANFARKTKFKNEMDSVNQFLNVYRPSCI